MNLTSPMILCFALGVAAALAKSDLHVPETLGRGMSIYLMLAIGFKGGHAVITGDAGVGEVVPALLVAILLSFLMPPIAYAALRAFARIDRIDAGAIAAHYGSVSVVTFVTAVQFLEIQGIPFEGYLVAMMALMETPAIISGLILARAGGASGAGARAASDGGAGGVGGRLGLSGELLREIFLNASVVLLIGGFLIGSASGARGMDAVAPLVRDLFNGVLCLFLLDMGLLAARRLSGAGALDWRLVVFALVMPPVGALFGLGAAAALGLSLGGAALLAVLAASASYIAVPAAMRLALPEANPGIYVTLSLVITFPFNVLVGIPLYFACARLVGFA